MRYILTPKISLPPFTDDNSYIKITGQKVLKMLTLTAVKTVLPPFYDGNSDLKIIGQYAVHMYGRKEMFYLTIHSTCFI